MNKPPIIFGMRGVGRGKSFLRRSRDVKLFAGNTLHTQRSLFLSFFFLSFL
jgi:hypothetical protein